MGQPAGNITLEDLSLQQGAGTRNTAGVRRSTYRDDYNANNQSAVQSEKASDKSYEITAQDRYTCAHY